MKDLKPYENKVSLTQPTRRPIQSVVLQTTDITATTRGRQDIYRRRMTRSKNLLLQV